VKKYLVVALAALFVLGFAASSFAIHAEIPAETQAAVAAGGTQITIGGDIRIRGRIVNNVSDFNSGGKSVGDNSFWDERVRLQVEAKVTPNTTGLIQLESGDSNHDTYTWGKGAGSNTGMGATGIITAGDYKPSTVNILQAWILHQGTGLLGVPALVKIGHMPIQIDSLFYSHTKYGDDALLLGVDPIKGMHIIAGTVKLGESSTTFTQANLINGTNLTNTNTSRDVNGYTLIASYAFDKDSAVGFDITYADGQNMQALYYPIFATPGYTNNGPTLPGDLHLWNFAVNGKTRIAGLGIKAELDFQSGSATDLPTSMLGDLKFRGMAAKLDLDYKINPVTLMFSAAYGSGDDFNKLTTGVGGSYPTGDHKIRNFITTLENIQHYTLVYEYFTQNAAGNISGGLQNTWFLNLGAKADLMKNLDGMINIYYLQAVETTAACVNAQRAGVPNPFCSKDIGTEVDVNLNYQIDKNLKYYVEGGYLFAGNFWKNLTPSAVNAGGISGKSPDDAWVLRHGIQLSF